MGITYSVNHIDFYTKLSRLTGMSNDELDLFFLKMTKVIKDDLNRKGKVTVPYLGRFKLKRMPPRKRELLESPADPNSRRVSIIVPAEDKLKFTINKRFSKLFR